ncbi:MAG: prealbumin-like fold domain-containing protein, partial [Geminicoccaceae bacterium]
LANPTLKVVKEIEKGSGSTQEPFKFAASGLVVDFEIPTSGGSRGESDTFKLVQAGGTLPANPLVGIAETDQALLDIGFKSVSASCSDSNKRDPNIATVTSQSDGSHGISIAFTPVYGAAYECTFTNRKVEASLTLVKRTIGGNGPGPFSFPFTLSGPATELFSSDIEPLQTAPDGESRLTGFRISEGSLTITEKETDGFTLDNIVCEGADGEPNVNVANRSVTLEVAAGDAITCTFTNRSTKANLKLVKVTTRSGGGERDGTFTFNGVGATTFTDRKLTVSGGNQASAVLSVNAGALTITEEANAAFDFTSASCKSGGQSIGEQNSVDRSVSLTVTGGEDVTCTFTNNRRADPTLTIVKKTLGGEGVFGFSVTPQSGGQPLSVPDIDTRKSSRVELTLADDLTAGKWDVKENDAPGFELTEISCKDLKDPNFVLDHGYTRSTEQRTASLDVQFGGAYECTFINRVTVAKLTLRKKTIGGEGKFRFTSSGSAGFESAIVIETSNGKSEDMVLTVNEGDLTITETAADGFALQNVECTGAESKWQEGEDFVDLKVDGGDDITCTFTNRRTIAQLTLVKETTDGEGTFSFSGSGKTTFSEQRITTSNGRGALPASITVNEGQLTITEAAADGFALKAVSCTGADFTPRKSDRAVDLSVVGGQDVTCTFTNRRTVAELTLIKQTLGGDGTFTFNGSGSSTFSQSISTSGGSGQPVTVTVNEGKLVITEKPAKGFFLEKAECKVDGNAAEELPFDPAAPRISLNVVAGQTIACTFVNRESAGRTTTIIRNFLKKRAEHLTNDTGGPRLIERQRISDGGSLKDAIGATGSGSIKDGTIGWKASISKLDGDQTAAKAARQGVNLQDYKLRNGRHRPGLDIWSEG